MMMMMIACKNMAPQNGPYNTNSKIHNFYYPNQITRKFQTLQSPPHSVQSSAKSSNTKYMSYSQKGLWQNSE
jgi:hypothetical protein